MSLPPLQQTASSKASTSSVRQLGQRPVGFAGLRLVNTAGDQVTFSGLANQAGKTAKKAGLGTWKALKQLRTLMTNSPDGKILQGAALKYGAPAALTAGLMAFTGPFALLLYPLIGIPFGNRLANRGDAMLEAEKTRLGSGSKSIVHRLTNVFDSLFDPEKGQAKEVIGDYNSVKDDLLDRMGKDPKAAKAIGGKSALDKLKRFLHLTPGSFGYNLVGKLVNASKVYATSRLGGIMRRLMAVGKRWKALMPLSILANGLFVAAKWKKINI